MKHISRMAVIILKKGDILSANGSGVAGSAGVLEPAHHKPSEVPRAHGGQHSRRIPSKGWSLGLFLYYFFFLYPPPHLLLTPACSSRVRSEITSLKNLS